MQSRNTKWPIKFNGMAFIAARGANAEADSRGWGACNWWQNTRLPYGAMLAAGDFDTFQVILEYKLNQEKLLSQRTQLYWNHTGMWTTETSHLTGAYCPGDYGCSRQPGYPVIIDLGSGVCVCGCVRGGIISRVHGAVRPTRRICMLFSVSLFWRMLNRCCANSDVRPGSSSLGTCTSTRAATPARASMR